LKKLKNDPARKGRGGIKGMVTGIRHATPEKNVDQQGKKREKAGNGAIQLPNKGGDYEKSHSQFAIADVQIRKKTRWEVPERGRANNVYVKRKGHEKRSILKECEYLAND